MTISEAQVRAALAGVLDPETGRDILAAGAVSDIHIEDGKVRLVLEVAAARAEAMRPVAQAAEKAVGALPGVETALVVMTAHAAAPRESAPPPPSAPQQRVTTPRAAARVEGVARIVVVGSGKGGVGKSTVAANLAVALAAEGWRVGLLDADIYGPSQPRMLGISGRPSSPDGKIIEPLSKHGVALMSIGLLTPEDAATIWRGPMLAGALQQMLHQVRWGALDVLLVDLPPGTGDVQLTLSQKTELTGAIVVSTPQDVALLDARKALDMFKKTGTHVIGMIENMSTFVCPECGAETQIFGHGGAEQEAARIGAPFLGALPLDLDVRLSGDAGTPIVVARPESPQAQRFREIARRLIQEKLV